MNHRRRARTSTAELATDLVEALIQAKVLTGELIGVSGSRRHDRWFRGMETIGFVYEFHADLRTAHEMAVRVARALTSVGGRAELDAAVVAQMLKPILADLSAAAVRLARDDERGSRLHVRDRGRGRALIRALQWADRCGELLVSRLVATGAVAAAHARVGTVATRLTGRAVRLLQPWARARYSAEYRSELYELAAAGASRWRQAWYAVRLIGRSWMLRAELGNALGPGGLGQLPSWARESGPDIEFPGTAVPGTESDRFGEGAVVDGPGAD